MSLRKAILRKGSHRTESLQKANLQKKFPTSSFERFTGRRSTEEEVKRLLLVNATHYHSQLLYNLYAATNKGDHYLFFSDDCPAEYKEQLASWRANPAVRNGNEFENWVCPDGQDHYFDCEKMGLALKDFFVEKVLPLVIRSRRA